MQVYDITVRFMRRIQLREYEPAEAEVTIKAQLADNEKPETAIDSAVKIASEHVHQALGLPADTKLPKRGKAGGETAASATVAPAAAKTEAAKPQAPAQTAKPAAQTSASDIPGEGAPAPQQASKAAASDIPDSAPQQAAQASSGTVEQITAAELSKWIGEQVRAGKVTSQAIMGLYPKFGVSRFADLKPEKCGEAKQAIEELISGAPAL